MSQLDGDPGRFDGAVARLGLTASRAMPGSLSRVGRRGVAEGKSTLAVRPVPGASSEISSKPSADSGRPRVDSRNTNEQPVMLDRSRPTVPLHRLRAGRPPDPSPWLLLCGYDREASAVATSASFLAPPQEAPQVIGSGQQGVQPTACRIELQVVVNQSMAERCCGMPMAPTRRTTELPSHPSSST